MLNLGISCQFQKVQLTFSTRTLKLSDLTNLFILLLTLFHFRIILTSLLLPDYYLPTWNKKWLKKTSKWLICWLILSLILAYSMENQSYNSQIISQNYSHNQLIIVHDIVSRIHRFLNWWIFCLKTICSQFLKMNCQHKILLMSWTTHWFWIFV